MNNADSSIPQNAGPSRPLPVPYYLEVAKLTDSLWRWAGDPPNLVWVDNSLIATNAEILAVLKALLPGGMPRFGSMVFLFACMRDKGFKLMFGIPTDDQEINFRLPSLVTSGTFRCHEAGRIRKTAPREAFLRVAKGLNDLRIRLRRLPQKPETIIWLARTVLSPDPYMENPAELIDVLERRLFSSTRLNNPGSGYKWSTFFPDIQEFLPKVDLLSNTSAIIAGLATR